MTEQPIWHIEYNEEGEPMLVEDDGIVYASNGLVDRYAMGLINPIDEDCELYYEE